MCEAGGVGCCHFARERTHRCGRGFPQLSLTLSTPLLLPLPAPAGAAKRLHAAVWLKVRAVRPIDPSIVTGSLQDGLEHRVKATLRWKLEPKRDAAGKDVLGADGKLIMEKDHEKDYRVQSIKLYKPMQSVYFERDELRGAELGKAAKPNPGKIDHAKKFTFVVDGHEVAKDGGDDSGGEEEDGVSG